MKKYLLLFISVISLNAKAQQSHVMTPAEKQLLPQYVAARNGGNTINTGITTPPSSPVRTIGEWEELQGFSVMHK